MSKTLTVMVNGREQPLEVIGEQVITQESLPHLYAKGHRRQYLLAGPRGGNQMVAWEMADGRVWTQKL